jgi:hypothetical protein
MKPTTEWNWLDEIDDGLDNVTVTGGGYSLTSNDTITLGNPGAVTGGITINSGAGGFYPNTITSPYTIGTSITQNPWAKTTSVDGKLNLDGKDADLVINGRSLTDTLSKLEERLYILNITEKLESEWSELKELGDRYRELEAHITAKMKTYEALKRYDEN